MKRTFERKSNLPAFECELATFEHFLNEIAKEFPSGNTHLSINVKSPGENLSFKSVEEMRQYQNLPFRIGNLTVHIGDYGWEDSRSLYLGNSAFDLPKVSAEGPSEAWCAGLVEKMRLFARQHRSWYWFIKPWVVFILNTLALVALVVGLNGPSNYRIPIVGLLSLMIFWLIILYLTFSYGRIFKPFVLISGFKESWLKKHSTEITIAAAIVSALAALYTALK
jgi:hypothetical protein